MATNRDDDILNNNQLNQSLYDSSGMNNLFAPKGVGGRVKQPSKKDIENAQLAAQQQEIDYIASTFMQNKLWSEGSLQQKEELRDFWANNTWGQYVQERFNGNEEAALPYKTAILGAFNRSISKQRQEIGQSSGLGNVWEGIKQGAQTLYTGVTEGLPFVADAAQVKYYTGQLEDVQAERNRAATDPSIDETEKVQLLNQLDSQIGDARFQLQQAAGSLRERALNIQEANQERQESQARRESKFAAEWNRQTRRRELGERGSDTPLLDSWLEASIGQKISDAIILSSEQGANIIASVVPTVALQAVGVPAPLTLMATQGVLGGSQVANEAIDEILNLPLEELSTYPEYQILVDMGKSEQEAREALATVAALQALPEGVAVSAATALFGPEAILSRGATPLAGVVRRLRGASTATPRTGVVGTIAAGAGRVAGKVAEGALGEATEEALQQIATNRAINAATGRSNSVFEGVADAAFAGALAGGPFSGAGSFRTHGKPNVDTQGSGQGTLDTAVTESANLSIPAADVELSPEVLALGQNPLVQANRGADALVAIAQQLDAWSNQDYAPNTEQMNTIFAAGQEAVANGANSEAVRQLLDNFQVSIRLPEGETQSYTQRFDNYIASALEQFSPEQAIQKAQEAIVEGRIGTFPDAAIDLARSIAQEELNFLSDNANPQNPEQQSRRQEMQTLLRRLDKEIESRINAANEAAQDTTQTAVDNTALQENIQRVNELTDQRNNTPGLTPEQYDDLSRQISTLLAERRDIESGATPTQVNPNYAALDISEDSTVFSTGRGSAYVVNSDGTTTRNRVANADGPGGVQPASNATVYVDRDGLGALDTLQTRGGPATELAFLSNPDRAVVRYTEGPNKGKYIDGTTTSYSTTPQVGLYPVERFDNGQVHFGTQITEVLRGAEVLNGRVRQTAAAETDGATGSSTNVSGDVETDTTGSVRSTAPGSDTLTAGDGQPDTGGGAVGATQQDTFALATNEELASTTGSNGEGQSTVSGPDNTGLPESPAGADVSQRQLANTERQRPSSNGSDTGTGTQPGDGSALTTAEQQNKFADAANGITRTPEGYDRGKLTELLGAVVETSEGAQQQDMQTALNSLLEGDLDTADAQIEEIKQRREGARVLGEARQLVGSEVEAVSRAMQSLRNGELEQLQTAYSLFQQRYQPEGYEGIAYAQRTFDVAFADALASVQTEFMGRTTDPWYNRMKEHERLIVAKAYSDASNTTAILTTNNVIPLQTLEGTNVTFNATEDLSEKGSAINSWVNQQKPFGRNKYILVDEGRAKIIDTDGSILADLDYIPARQFGDGAALSSINATPTFIQYESDGQVFTTPAYGALIAPEGSLNSNATIQKGARVVTTDAISFPRSVWNQYLNDNFQGHIVITQQNQTNMETVAGTVERDMLTDVRPGQPAPDSITDTNNKAFDSSTQVKSDNGEWDAQGTLVAAIEPEFGSGPGVHQSNAHNDKFMWHVPMAQTMDEDSNVSYQSDADLGFDSVDNPVFTDGITQPPADPAPQPSTLERAAESAEYVSEINENISLDEGTTTDLTPAERTEVASLAQQLYDTIQAERVAAADRAQAEELGRFSRPAYGPAITATKYRSIMASLRKGLVDKATPLLEWITRVQPVANGEFDDHPLWKAWTLTKQRTRALNADMQAKIATPYQKFVVNIAKQRGEHATDVWRDLGSYATAYHVLTEGSQAFRNQLAANVEQALASGDQNLAAEAQKALADYDAYQAGTGPKVNTAGGLSDVEWQRVVQYLLDRGYTEAELETARSMLVNMGQEITNRRIEAGTLNIAETEAWFPFVSYVPLFTEQDAARFGQDDAGRIFNPARDHERTGAVTPAMNAGDALMTYMSRAANEIGMREFRNELAIAYDSLAADGNTQGLQRIDMSQLSQLPDDQRLALLNQQGFLHRTVTANDDGTTSVKTYKYYFSDENLQKAVTDQVRSNSLLEGTSAATRLFARMITKYRLAFAPVNALRDHIERLVNTTARDFRTEDGDVVGGQRIAARAAALAANPILARDMAMAMLGRDVDSHYGRLFEEFRTSGAYYTFNQFLGRGKEKVAAQLKAHYGAPLYADLVSKGFDAWNDYGNTLPAFVSYVAMRQSGLTSGDAAFWVTDMMNFNARGTAADVVAPFFPFIVPIVQSSANILRSLGLHMGASQNPRAAQRGWAGFAGLIMFYAGVLPLISAQAGNDDDSGVSRLDALSPSQLQNAIPFFGNDGSQIRIPIGFGLSQVAWISAVMFDRVSRGVADPGDAFFEIFLSFTKNIAPQTYPDYDFRESPAKWLAQTFTPFVLRPITDLAVNKDNFGREISRGRSSPGTPKAESGRHRTPDVWHNLAKDVREMTGFDTTPEDMRHFFQGYLIGPLSGMMAWLEQDSLYKRPEYKSTRDELGPVLSALGLGTLYNSATNVSNKVFYDKKRRLENEINRVGVKLTDPGNVGKSSANVDNFVQRELSNAGFDPVFINDYIAIRQAERDIRRLDRKFADNTRIYRNQDLSSDTLKDAYADWDAARGQIIRNALTRTGQ